MLKRVHIRGFRGLRDLTVDGLAPITLIAGKNDVGKTSLLEALFLASSPLNGALTVSVNAIRRLPLSSDAGDLWAWLFHRSGGERSFQVETTSIEKKRSTRATMEATLIGSPVSAPMRKRADGTAVVNGSAHFSQQDPPRHLQLTFKRGAKRQLVVFEPREKGLHLIDGKQTNIVAQRPCMFLPFNREEIVTIRLDGYSRIVAEGRRELFVERLRHLEPRLLSVEILQHAGFPTLHAKLDQLGFVPLPMMGQGFDRFVDVLLALEAVRDGLLLIDEIDAGIHYSALRSYWNGLIESARALGVQVIATTHSRECLNAAAAADDDGPTDDVALVRLDRTKDGIESTHYSESELKEAARLGIEVR